MILFLLFAANFASDVKFTPLEVVPASDSLLFAETFHDGWDQVWVVSSDEDFKGGWEVQNPSHGLGQNIAYPSSDSGLTALHEAKKHAISAPFKSVLNMEGQEELLVQYEVRLQKGLSCGGAYIKLLTANTLPASLEEFNNKVPFTIMFGPDKCGLDSKVHFILQHKNPISKLYTEHHMTNRPKIIDDLKTHLYTLIIKNDNTFSVRIDDQEVRHGSLLEDFEPPINPPKVIDDPTDKMPDDWELNEEIRDPTSFKPDDWDEDAPKNIPDPDDSKPESWLDDGEKQIQDPSVSRPDDWIDEEDGEWAAPLIDNPDCKPPGGCGVWRPRDIPNPNYKGKWSPKMIPNPKYIGPWTPKQIDNPHFFEDKEPWKLEPISAIGIEIWTMSPLIMFDNFIITNNVADALPFTESWKEKNAYEVSLIPGSSFFENIAAGLNSFSAFVANPDNIYYVLPIAGLVLVLPVVFFFCVTYAGGDSAPKKKKKTGDIKLKQN